MARGSNARRALLCVHSQASVDGVAAAPMIFTRDLQFGDRGRDVRRLQKDLLFVKTTGRFDASTHEAMRAWQRTNDLPQTGYFGKLSRAVAEKLVRGDPDGGSQHPDAQPVVDEAVSWQSTAADAYASGVQSSNYEDHDLTYSVQTVPAPISTLKAVVPVALAVVAGTLAALALSRVIASRWFRTAVVVSRRKVRAILAAMRVRLESETGAEHASRPTADTNREERGLPEWVQNLRMSMWLRSSKADQAQMFPAVEAADPSADPAASDAIPTDLNANEEEDGELSYALQKMQQQHIPLPGFSEDPPDAFSQQWEYYQQAKQRMARTQPNINPTLSSTDIPATENGKGGEGWWARLAGSKPAQGPEVEEPLPSAQPPASPLSTKGGLGPATMRARQERIDNLTKAYSSRHPAPATQGPISKPAPWVPPPRGQLQKQIQRVDESNSKRRLPPMHRTSGEEVQEDTWSTQLTTDQQMGRRRRNFEYDQTDDDKKQ